MGLDSSCESGTREGKTLVLLPTVLSEAEIAMVGPLSCFWAPYTATSACGTRNGVNSPPTAVFLWANSVSEVKRPSSSCALLVIQVAFGHEFPDVAFGMGWETFNPFDITGIV